MQKKQFVLATALLASAVAWSQQHKIAPPPPPPPPPVESIEPPPPPPVPEIVLPKDYSDFLTRNKQVKSLDWSNGGKVTIHLKSGKKEVYDLNNKEQAKNLVDKYGELPEAPPPPPPPPPAPPKARSQES